MMYLELPKDNIPLVLLGDVMKCLKNLPSESISCIVTSPPYWNLRDYYIEGQIGLEKTPEEYISKIVEISKELIRVLKKDGAFFLNIGDTYVDKGLQMIPQRIAFKMINEVKMICNNKRIGWLLRNQIIWYKPNHMPSPVKTRYTNTYEHIYFFTRDDWEKKVYFNIDLIRTPYKSENEANKYSQKSLNFQNFNYDKSVNNSFGFPEVLSEKEYKEMLPEIENKNREFNYKGKFKGHETNVGASPGGRSSITGINYVRKRKIELPQNIICDYLRQWKNKKGITIKEIDEYLGYAYTAGHWFREDAGGSLPSPQDWINLKELLKFDDKYDKEMTEMHYVLQIIKKHPYGKNPGDLWTMNCAKLEKAHFSVFPEQLPKNAILACCPHNGIVLDPFAGSGTTGKVAKELNRKSILIELQPMFLDIIKERCGNIQEIKI